MPKLQRTPNSERAHTRHNWMAVLTAALLSPSLGSAQTIYRCGNDYAAAATCEQAQAVSSSPAPLPATQARQTQAEQQALQKQADPLEKQRLQSERMTPAHTPALTSEPADHKVPAAHSKHRRMSTPYFTARSAAAPKTAKATKKPAQTP